MGVAKFARPLWRERLIRRRTNTTFVYPITTAWSSMTRTLNEVLVLDAARRALRTWLSDVGRDGCAIDEPSSHFGTFHLRDLQRVVCAKGAVAPGHPPFVSAREAALLLELAKRLGAQAWEARVLLRPNYHPQAVIWRSLSDVRARVPAGADVRALKRARRVRFAAHQAAAY
jgi:hypothetical protein